MPGTLCIRSLPTCGAGARRFSGRPSPAISSWPPETIVLRQRKAQRAVEKEYSQHLTTQEQREHEELMTELQRVIDDNLTEQDRRVLTLHYDEAMTYAQAAQALGISTSAVNKHVTSSLKKIRNILKITR